MAVEYRLDNLPTDIETGEAIDTVFRQELGWVEDKLRKHMSVLVECDKELGIYLMQIFRRRLGLTGEGGVFRFQIISGIADMSEVQGMRPSLLTMMLHELADAVRSAEENTIIVIPHLDLLTTTTRTGLSDAAKEIIAYLYENPEVTFLGFKDPSMDLPESVSRLFLGEQSFLGIPREGLPRIILKREARKFGLETFNPFQLYKYVSGVTPVRFRQIMSSILGARMDFNPQSPEMLRSLYQDIRRLTLGGELDVPSVDLEKDIGGYARVKERIREDILDLYERKETLSSEEEIKNIEELIPKGIIFEGPPGTGKTFFAKAMATILDATVIVVSGPELKSKWVGESEQNLRKTFNRARQNAPAIIIFDEIDSFATRRGSYTGSGVEHSMVNQLLTEMDGFRKEELVFVVATTNFAESLDPALLRPGRFELTIEIPYPDEKDRKEIINIYRKKFDLDLTDEMVDYIVSKTEGYSNYEHRTKFSGDHLYAICRALARENIRKGKHATTKEDVDKVVDHGFSIRPPTESERQTIAVHEVGHALVAIMAEKAPAPDKVSLQGLADYASAYVKQEEWEGDHVRTKQELLDQVCVCLGGRAAEEVLLKTCSSGASNDLEQASHIARVMVEKLGMSGDENLMVAGKTVSAERQASVEKQVNRILQDEMTRAKRIVQDEKKFHAAILKELLKQNVLHKPDLKKIAKELGKDIEKLSWEKGYALDAD